MELVFRYAVVLTDRGQGSSYLGFSMLGDRIRFSDNRLSFRHKGTICLILPHGRECFPRMAYEAVIHKERYVKPVGQDSFILKICIQFKR